MVKKYISPESQQYFAFNIWDVASAKAVLKAAQRNRKSVILQTSTKAFEGLDKELLRYCVIKYNRDSNIKAFLHLDHCRSIDNIEKAISYGWDSVMLDASDKSLEENIRLTNDVSDLIGEKNVLLEAEVGQIVGVEDEISVKNSGIARIEDVIQFLNETQVQMLAMAIGTAHGLYKGEPALHYELLEKVTAFTDMPLVIHGGTGLTDEIFMRLLSYKNVKKINISTDIKQAYRRAICSDKDMGLLEKEGFDPLRITNSIDYTIGEIVKRKLDLLQ